MNFRVEKCEVLVKEVGEHNLVSDIKLDIPNFDTVLLHSNWNNLRRKYLRWLTTVLMEYKSTIFNSFEKGSKLFFPSLFNACLSLLPFYVKFEQLNVNKWPK